MSDGPEWFAPKRYGYGAGSPISWQGWALLAGYIVLITCAGFALLPRNWLGYASLLIILTVVFTMIAARTTRGGWRWRWGKKEK